ncbi:MAG TPA: L-threonylcarbamoyladenylate synthase [Acidimicrobiales bacterium]|nr:L-threonylcarbamoyladenylate synthase [Acidimicrobiales bacterium]
MTEVVTVHGGAGVPDPAVLARVVAALGAGEVVVLPTDTVYGLAASPAVEGATDRLFALKGRRRDVPLAVLCADAGQALALADPASVTAEVRRVAERLWPGPLTLVLPRRPGLRYALGEPAATIGVRCPDHPLVRAVAAATGPLATTSANRHGRPTPAAAPAVAVALGPGPALVVDGGPCAGTPSTVVDLTGSRWSAVREGALSLAAVQAAAAP